MKTYLGVDLAGENGNTGVAEILEAPEGLFYQFPQESWQGREGLERIEKRCRAAEKTAVDQPFSYPAPCMRWFLGQPGSDTGIDPFLWRRTDREMADRISKYGIPRSTVQQVSRSSSVWRAVELANLLGLSREAVCGGAGRLVETHPRVAWTLIIVSLADPEVTETLVAHYKGATASPEDRGQRNQQKELREKMLLLLSEGTGLRPRQAGQRELACKTDDNLDALICAFVAYLADHRAAERCLPPRVSEETLLLEGAAVVPTQDWQARLLVKKGQH